MNAFIRQSTAVNVIIGPFVDSTDGDSEETVLTIAQADIRLSKNAGADAQKSDVTSAAHEGDGCYMCELDATDTNTVGQLTLWVHVAGALFVRHDFQVVEEAVFDALFASSAAGYGTAQTGDSFARIGATGSGLTSLASQATLNTLDDFVDTEVAVILAAVDTEVAAIKAKTDPLPANPAAVSDIPTAIQNADALLARDIGSGTGAGTTNERTVRSALRFNRNKFTLIAGTLTVYEEDDTTVAWTGVATQTAGNPVSAVDPA